MVTQLMTGPVVPLGVTNPPISAIALPIPTAGETVVHTTPVLKQEFELTETGVLDVGVVIGLDGLEVVIPQPVIEKNEVAHAL